MILMLHGKIIILIQRKLYMVWCISAVVGDV